MGNGKRPANARRLEDTTRLALIITGQGSEGQVMLESRFDGPTTARLLREVADRYAASLQPQPEATS